MFPVCSAYINLQSSKTTELQRDSHGPVGGNQNEILYIIDEFFKIQIAYLNSQALHLLRNILNQKFIRI